MTNPPPPQPGRQPGAVPPPAAPASATAPTSPTAPTYAVAAPSSARRPRRGRLIAIIAIVVVLLLAVAAVIADFQLRSYAEGQVRQNVVANMPEGVTGDVDVSIGGGPFILQYLTGTFSQVTLDSKNLEVKGVPVQATVTAYDVSTDQTKPIPKVSASMTLDEQAVNSFLNVPGSSDITFGAGTVGYTGQQQILGLPVGYTVTATVAPQGPDVLFTPVSAQLNAGGASFDASGLLKAVQSKPISICVAQYLPQGVQLTSITPSNGSVTVTAEATNVTPTREALATTGTC